MEPRRYTIKPEQTEQKEQREISPMNIEPSTPRIEPQPQPAPIPRSYQRSGELTDEIDWIYGLRRENAKVCPACSSQMDSLIHNPKHSKIIQEEEEVELEIILPEKITLNGCTFDLRKMDPSNSEWESYSYIWQKNGPYIYQRDNFAENKIKIDKNEEIKITIKITDSYRSQNEIFVYGPCGDCCNPTGYKRDIRFITGSPIIGGIPILFISFNTNNRNEIIGDKVFTQGDSRISLWCKNCLYDPGHRERGSGKLQI